MARAPRAPPTRKADILAAQLVLKFTSARRVMNMSRCATSASNAGVVAMTQSAGVQRNTLRAVKP